MIRENPTPAVTESSESHPDVERATRLANVAGFGSWAIGWGFFALVALVGAPWMAWAFAGWYILLALVVYSVTAIPRRRQAQIDRELSHRFRELSEHDDLTGLYNRRYFNGELVSQIAACHAEGRPLSIAMIDLDNFKGINDSFGHPTGDIALRVAAQAIVDAAPAGATVARTGGDEFAAIMPGAGRGDAEQAAARIRSAIASANFVIEGAQGGRGRIHATVGIATLGTDFDPGHLLQEADSALYAGKRRGLAA